MLSSPADSNHSSRFIIDDDDDDIGDQTTEDNESQSAHSIDLRLTESSNSSSPLSQRPNVLTNIIGGNCQTIDNRHLSLIDDPSQTKNSSHHLFSLPKNQYLHHLDSNIYQTEVLYHQINQEQKRRIDIHHHHHNQPPMSSSSYVDNTTANSSSREHSPEHVGTPVTGSLRYCANNQFISSLGCGGASVDDIIGTKFLTAAMHSSSSSPPPPPPLASSTASTHYELPYRSLIERQRIVHEMQSNPSSCWKSWSDLEPSSSTQFGMIPHVPPPPPAHHNPTPATINRFLPTSTGYSVPSSLVSPTQSNSTNFLSSSSIAHDTQPTSGRTGNKSSSLTSGRRSNNNGTNRIPSAMKDTTEYKIKRERNNIAVRKSREKAKKRLRENENRANELMADNAQLRNRINILSSVLHGYRMLLHNYGKSQDEINSVLRKTLGSAAYEAIDQDSIINQLGHIDHHHHHHSHPHGLMSPNISGLPETLFCKSSSTIDSAHFTELHSQQQQQQQSSEGVLQHQEYGQHQEQSNLLQLQQQQQMH